MQKLLIADKTEEFRRALADAVQRDYLIKTCQDGAQTLEMIRSFQPNALVLDLMMPGMDGISLLQKMAEMESRPVILATTRFSNDFVLERVSRLGVGYVMLKPCPVEAVAARLADLTGRGEISEVARLDCRGEATNMLQELGLSAKLKGYTCVREAVLLKMQDPAQSATKELYPAVAKICGGNAVQVEKAIRSAIHAAWERRNETLWRRYFQSGPDGGIPRPTNATFISRLADCLAVSRENAG